MYTFLNDLMKENNMTRAELSRVSGVPESTLRDILSGKAQLDHCESGTILSIADSLDTTVEDILYAYWDDLLCSDEIERKTVHDYSSTAHFYMIVDAACTDLNEHMDLDFVSEICKEKMIESFYQAGFYRAALFLLGLVDYLHRKHGLIPDPQFDAYRASCLDRPVYSLKTLEKDDSDDFICAKDAAEEEAIPELAVFNIFMTEEDVDPMAD